MVGPDEAGHEPVAPRFGAAAWNGPSGRAWVELEDVLSRMFVPLREVLLEAVGADPAGRVLDVGCGTGDTTLAIARALGSRGDCTGVDISEPMLEAARGRADREGVPARFVVADAQRHQFDPATFDLIVSRLGVMFFDDFVQAFANLRSATTVDGALRLVVWRGPDENPFMTTGEHAVAPFVTIPPHDPDAPGPFALADPSRTAAILQRAGWQGVDLQPVDLACTMPESDLVRYLTRIGPVGRAVAELDPETQTRVVEAVRPAFDPFVDGSEVRFTAACWLVAAHA